MEALELVSRISSDCSGQLNAQAREMSAELVSELSERFRVAQVQRGVCVYQIAELAGLTPEPLNSKQIGTLHDLTVKRPFHPIDVRLLSADLNGQLLYSRIL